MPIGGGSTGITRISDATDVSFSALSAGDSVVVDGFSDFTNEPHTLATDPHAAAKYAIMPDGGRQIFTRTTDPAADGAVTIAEGDIWLGP